MIRLMQPEDKPRVVELGRQYLLLGPYRGQLTDNPAQVDAFIASLTQGALASAARILVLDIDGQVEGVFCFILYPHYYGGDLVASEMIWCVDEAHRRHSLSLLWEAERMARELGAVRMGLTAPTLKVRELYDHLKGYSLVEVCYQANLAERVPQCL